MFEWLKGEIANIREKDPAARSNAQILLQYQGLRAIMYHRLAYKLHHSGHKFLAEWLSKRARKKTGIEIHPAAKIGNRVFIDHGMGVVIGETAEVGDDCTIYQGVTLGGTGKDRGKRHPTIGKNVLIGSGAKVLGGFTVGDNSKIAANAVVLCEVPPNSTCVGVPGRIVSKKVKEKPKCDLDQIHMPDPLSMELCKLMMRIDKLEKQVEKLSGEKPV